MIDEEKAQTPLTGATKIKAIRTIFEMNQTELARVIHVCPPSIRRWESGSNPTGLPLAIIDVLYDVAHAVKDDDLRRRKVCGVLLRMGVNGLLEYYLLKV